MQILADNCLFFNTGSQNRYIGQYTVSKINTKFSQHERQKVDNCHYSKTLSAENKVTFFIF